ncbi:MAG: hypothetical protein Q4Q62_07255 [Thermoplasmata archaeon]|nr:hypothetical protein [Thermoplasmata archaeon]
MSYNLDSAVVLKQAATAQTAYEEVVEHNPISFPQGLCLGQKVPYSSISRIVDVCCIAELLRNFPISSLRGDEVARFEELQSFFFELADRSLAEAGIE